MMFTFLVGNDIKLMERFVGLTGATCVVRFIKKSIDGVTSKSAQAVAHRFLS